MNDDHEAADIHGVPDSERLSRAGEIAGGKAVAGEHAGSAAALPSAASAGSVSVESGD